MDKVTVISMHASYGLAAVLFFGVAMWKTLLVRRDMMTPPPLPVGKVSSSIYHWPDIFAVGILVGFYYLMFLLQAYMPAQSEEVEITAPVLIFNIGLQIFLAAMVLVCVVTRINPVSWLGIKWRDWPWVVLIAPATVAAMWACFAGLYVVGYQAFIESLGVEMVQDTVELFQKTEDIGVLILMAFTAVIIAPLCEEVVFRGYLYPVLKKFNGPWIGALVSALIFSAAHSSMAALLPLFIFGVLLVYLYEWTGSIWAPIAAHFLFNAATVAMQMLIRFGVIPEQAVQ